jgi:hypothetical protein
MFLKLIQCIVPTDHDPEFSKAQEGWKETGHSPGFIAQWGGWEVGQPRHAWILSFWDSKKDLYRFMDLHHDRIQKENGQVGTYTDITLQHGKLVEPESIPASEIHQKLSGHIATCILHFAVLPLGILPDGILHFKIFDPTTTHLFIQFMDSPGPAPSPSASGRMINGVDPWHIPPLSGIPSIH